MPPFNALKAAILEIGNQWSTRLPPPVALTPLGSLVSRYRCRSTVFAWLRIKAGRKPRRFGSLCPSVSYAHAPGLSHVSALTTYEDGSNPAPRHVKRIDRAMPRRRDFRPTVIGDALTPSFVQRI